MCKTGSQQNCDAGEMSLVIVPFLQLFPPCGTFWCYFSLPLQGPKVSVLSSLRSLNPCFWERLWKTSFTLSNKCRGLPFYLSQGVFLCISRRSRDKVPPGILPANLVRMAFGDMGWVSLFELSQVAFCPNSDPTLRAASACTDNNKLKTTQEWGGSGGGVFYSYILYRVENHSRT